MFGDFIQNIQSDEFPFDQNMCTCIVGETCGFCEYVENAMIDHGNSELQELDRDDIEFMNSRPSHNC